MRLRSADFGTPDEWLTATQGRRRSSPSSATTSRSPARRGSTSSRRTSTTSSSTRSAQKYNGKTAPRLVLFSPIAHEDLHDRNLPDGSENNARLELYTAAMAEVAKANGVPFVDLFTPTRELYAKAAEAADDQRRPPERATATGSSPQIIDAALFADGPAPKREPAALEQLRQAVLDKNFYWFNRYRTVDGYSIYGGRADLKFVDGQTNRDVVQREMEVLDVMTANRDKRDLGRRAGRRPQGRRQQHAAVHPRHHQQARPAARTASTSSSAARRRSSKMTVAKGHEGQPLRLREGVPRAGQPGADGVRHQGPAVGRRLADLSALEAEGGDERQAPHPRRHRRRRQGRQVHDVFADDLHSPTGFEFWNGGVLVAQAPDLLFLKDTDGDDKADVRERVLQRPRLGRHAPHGQQLRARSGRGALLPGRHVPPHAGRDARTARRCAAPTPASSATSRGRRSSTSTSPTASPTRTATSSTAGARTSSPMAPAPTRTTRALFSGHVDYPAQARPRRRRSTSSGRGPAPASRSSRSRHFPDEMQGNLLVANVIGFQGILQYKIEDNGASFAGDRARADRLVDAIRTSARPTSRSARTARSTSPTGTTRSSATCSTTSAIPAATATHGRVYRVTYEGRPLLEAAPRSPASRSRSCSTCSRSRRTASATGPGSSWAAATRDEVIAAVDEVGRRRSTRTTRATSTTCSKRCGCTSTTTSSTRSCCERVLASPDFRARAAATRVLCYWRDRVSDALDLLKKLAADEHPRVRLEAVRAASFFTAPEAVEVAADRRRAADRRVPRLRPRRDDEDARAATGRRRSPTDSTIAFTTDAGARFFLQERQHRRAARR